MHEGLRDSIGAKLRETSGYERILGELSSAAKEGGPDSPAYKALDNYQRLISAQFQNGRGKNQHEVDQSDSLIREQGNDPAYSRYINKCDLAYDMLVQDVNGSAAMPKEKIARAVIQGYLGAIKKEISEPQPNN